VDEFRKRRVNQYNRRPLIASYRPQQCFSSAYATATSRGIREKQQKAARPRVLNLDMRGWFDDRVILEISELDRSADQAEV